jgi:hypothetical protein
MVAATDGEALTMLDRERGRWFCCHNGRRQRLHGQDGPFQMPLGRYRFSRWKAIRVARKSRKRENVLERMSKQDDFA